MDDQRVRHIKHYVLARLREELADAPRGSQARLAKRLGVSGAHLSNMLSSSPSRQPGEEFRRKVAAHWGITYAQLEALALGEEASTTPTQPPASHTSALPSNLAALASTYAWMPELPEELRVVVREQARQHFAFSHVDLPEDEWQRILTGLEREALALVARRKQAESQEEAARRRKRRAR